MTAPQQDDLDAWLDEATALPEADYVTDPFDDKDPGLRGIGSRTYPLPAGDQLAVLGAVQRTLVATLDDGEAVAPAALSDNAVHVYDQRRGVWTSVTVAEVKGRLLDLYRRGLWYESQAASGERTLKRWACSAGALKKIAEEVVAACSAPHHHPLRRPRPGLACESGFVRATPRGVVVAAHSPRNGATWYYDAPLRPWAKVRDSDAYARSLHRRFFEGADDGTPGVWADRDDREDLVRLIHQIFYIGLTGQGPRFHRICMIVGEPGTGKSQVVEMAQGLLGGRGVGSVQPARFGDDRYGATLDGVALNAVSELALHEPIEFGPLKAVVSGEPITRRQVYESPVTFRFLGQNLIASNGYPEISGAEEAAWDRWLLLRWEAPRFRGDDVEIRDIGRKIGGSGNVVLTEDPETGFLVEQPDPDRDREAREFLLAAVMDAGVALERDGLILPEMHHQEVERWQSEGDPVRAWVADVCEVLGPDQPASAGMTIAQLHESYRAWARAASLREVSRLALKRQLLSLGTLETEDGEQVRIHVERSNGSRYNLRVKVNGGPL